MSWLFIFVRSARGATPDGGPDAVVRSNCLVEGAAFVDLDLDGADDLVVKRLDEVLAWPTSKPGREPVRLGTENLLEDTVWLAELTSSWIGGAQITWLSETQAEFRVDPVTLDLGVLWSDSEEGRYGRYQGDLDGDGLADLVTGTVYRPSTAGTWLDLPPTWYDEDGERYAAHASSSAGDVNGDGYDDLVLSWTTYEYVDYTCSREWGPAELYLGSPTGLAPAPLWQLWAPNGEKLAVGEQVVAVPEQDALIVSLSAESWLCYDWSPLYLGVIREASTSQAYLDQVVQVPELVGTDWPYSYLAGMLPGPGGPTDLLVLDPAGDGQGVHWLRWDPESSRIEDPPVASWSGDGASHLYFGSLSVPRGRRMQALAHGWLRGDDSVELLVWGRTPEEVGPTTDPAGVPCISAVEECVFWAVDPDAADQADPAVVPCVVELPAADAACGCGSPAGAPLLALIAAGIGSRRSRGRGRASPSPSNA